MGEAWEEVAGHTRKWHGMVMKLGCPRCGEVELPVDQVGLRVGSRSQRDSSYRFDCPSCRQPVEKHADVRMLRLLRAQGIRAEEIAALTGDVPSWAASAPAFSADDLIDFHFALESDEAMRRLLALWSSGSPTSEADLHL